MATNEARIVLTAEDKTKGAFDSAKRNMGGLADQAKGIGSSNGRQQTLNGLLTFNADGTVTVTVNGHTHNF